MYAFKGDHRGDAELSYGGKQCSLSPVRRLLHCETRVHGARLYARFFIYDTIARENICTLVGTFYELIYLFRYFITIVVRYSNIYIYI